MATHRGVRGQPRRVLSKAVGSAPSRGALALANRAARTLRRMSMTPERARWDTEDGDRRRLEYALDSNSVVLDLGGFEGQWASDIFGRFACAIHVFEPVPAFATAIEARFSANPRIAVHDFGLGALTGELAISIEADRSSFTRSAGSTVLAKVVRADDALQGLGVAHVDLAKINIEGAEYDLLDHLLDTGWTGRIDNLLVQFHADVPDASARMNIIRSRLEASHDLEWCYEFVWESWRLRSPTGG